MKIVNLDQLLRLPAGTVFCKYEPYCFGWITFKADSCDRDFFVSDTITVSELSLECGEDILDRCRETGESFSMDLYSTGRDGCHDEDQLFAVFEGQDVRQLIDKLRDCIKDVRIAHMAFNPSSVQSHAEGHDSKE